jgi:hypothetical protein
LVAEENTMKRTLIHWLASAGIALVIILGCSTAVDVGSGSGSGSSGGGGGFASVDSEFSDAPASPGGTGGTDGGSGGTGGEDQGPVDLPSEQTRSFFTAFQVDPVEEDSAGPKFVVSGDVDQDGFTDLVSAWNQSQPIQLHLQRRDAAGNISFRSITLAGTTPIAVVSGLELGQINGDGFLDIVVLVKASGFGGFCPKDPPVQVSLLAGEIVVLFNPGDAAFIPDGDRWTEMLLVNPYVADRWIHNQFPGRESVDYEESKTKPENSGFTALAVGNIDGNPGDEIITALNPAECEELGQKPPANTVDLWVNPGGTLAENSTNWGVPSDIGLSRGVPISVMVDAPEVKDIALYDVDGDTDLDLVAAYSNSLSRNVRWARNPLIETGSAQVEAGGSDGDVDRCVGGAVENNPCDTDSDCPGIADGTCTGGVCVGGASPGGTCTASADCPGTADGVCVASSWHFLTSSWEQRPVGQIDTGADIITVGDADSDGFSDVVVRSTAGGIIQWFRRPNSLTLPPEFPPNDPVPDRQDFPWTVYTITEFTDLEPQAITLGDITGDGQAELLAAVNGGVLWFDATVGATAYDPWFGNTIIQDIADAQAGTSQQTSTTTPATDPNAPPPDPAAPAAPGGTGVGVNAVDSSTYINALLVVDLDGDGKNDVIGTLDRRAGSGLSDDRIVWYRNTHTDDPAPAP